MNIETMSRDGFVSVTYPYELRTCVRYAVESWQSFCKLLPEEKRQCGKIGIHRDVDYGYMRREEGDSKELFHVSLASINEFMKRACQINNPRAIEFIRYTDVLMHQIQAFILDFSRSVEFRYGVAGFADDVLAKRDAWTLRYLHYFGGEMLAEEHVDRMGFTLHLYESHDGGEYLDFNMAWKPFPINEKETIIFPGVGLQYRSGDLRALWHRVKGTEVTKACGRYALVLFVEFENGFECQNVKKQFQNPSPGFNYTLSPQAFKELCTR